MPWARWIIDRKPCSHADRGPRGAGRRSRPSVNTYADELNLVDADYIPIGTMPKLEAHRRGVRHRAIFVIIRDRRGRILLHKRALAKYHSGGLWTNTCCSHPLSGEDTGEAATRRLAEEMGIVCPVAQFILFIAFALDRLTAFEQPANLLPL
jgi:hypothetical protein